MTPGYARPVKLSKDRPSCLRSDNHLPSCIHQPNLHCGLNITWTYVDHQVFDPSKHGKLSTTYVIPLWRKRYWVYWLTYFIFLFYRNLLVLWKNNIEIYEFQTFVTYYYSKPDDFLLAQLFLLFHKNGSLYLLFFKSKTVIYVGDELRCAILPSLISGFSQWIV